MAVRPTRARAFSERPIKARISGAARRPFCISKESEETKKLYGLDDPDTEDTGRKCLLARRLVERGVRVVQIYSGSSQCGGAWDAHSDLKDGHRKCAKWIDRPIAALLQDLKRTGLLSQTLVVGLSEFGRMPISQGGTGRDHNPGAQTLWLAGAGIKPGTLVGATDPLGYRTIESPYHMRDLHATLLRLMGLDDIRLTFYFNGRNYRLTENGGQLIQQALSSGRFHIHPPWIPSRHLHHEIVDGLRAIDAFRPM